MERRELLKRSVIVMGYTVTGGTISTILESCSIKPNLKWQPKVLSKDQAQIVSAMTEVILPKSETPGATELNIAQFVDLMISDVFSPEDQQKFIIGLNSFREDCVKVVGNSFEGCNLDDQITVLTVLEEKTFEGRRDKSDDQVYFYKSLKNLALTGYFQSEKIGEELLNYDPVPGQYQSCIPLQGNSWSL